MIDVKVKTKFTFPDAIANIFADGAGDDLANIMVSEIKNTIARGESPVRDVGRFQGYKAVEQVNQIKKSKKKSAESVFRLIRSKKTSKNINDKFKNATSEAKKGYPYSAMKEYPNKTVRPVNLYLSGNMLANLDYRVNVAKKTVSIGYFNESKQKQKAETHNEGTQSPKVPRRQFLPTDDGDELIVAIQRKIVDFFRSRISDVIASSK